MTTPFQRVAVGLKGVTVGTLVVLLVWLVLAAAATLDAPSFFYAIRYALLGALAAGLALAFAGRCLCLAVPADARAARAWGVLAVLLDGCGLFSAVSNFALDQAGVWLRSEVIIGAALFSLGGMVLGRVAFMFYLRAVAKYVDARPLVERALTVFLHGVAVYGGAALGTFGLA